MRSLFWRILATLWLALALVAGLAILLGRALNQDAWILSHHPSIQGLAERLVQRYEDQGPDDTQRYLEHFRHRARIDVQILNDTGQPVVKGTFPHRAAAFEARQPNSRRLPWRRLTEEYTSPASGDSYLLIYRIPYRELEAWHRGSLLWPFSALGIALVVLTLFSLALTLSITRPLDRLRRAVHDLGQTAYQQDSLARLARRRDELGVLAGDFNRMGQRLQGLIGSQRQLLRDVSHELRSPLARLRIALALAERIGPTEVKPSTDSQAGLAAFTVPGQAQSVWKMIEADLKESGVTDLTSKYGPRLVEMERCAYLRPMIVHCASPEKEIAKKEFGFEQTPKSYTLGVDFPLAVVSSLREGQN